MVNKIINIIMAILPFLGNRKKREEMLEEVREFCELIKGQYGFLIEQLEKMLKDYFEVSNQVKEMHTEMLSLKEQLAEALALQCRNTNCIQRINKKP